MNDDLQKSKKLGPIGNLPMGENFLFRGGLLATVLSVLSLAGFLWQHSLFITELAVWINLFLGPVCLVGSLKDTILLGRTPKRCYAIVFSIIALASVALLFREIISLNPLFKDY